MEKRSEHNTRSKILRSAADMFSERGYEAVTIREIAKAVGINSASIYYHFPSKEDILYSLYRVYAQAREKACPDINKLLLLAETEPPHEVLLKSTFFYDEKDRDMLDKVLVTAARRLGSDEESEYFIRENILSPITYILRPLLERLIELGKIKPFDIGAFISVLEFYCFSAAALNNSPFRVGVAEYQMGMSFLFSLVEVVEQ
ncbi:MAG: TetR/AcrR family transcriptional regulator [Oscillospiraceae bacterium]|nr:TetR/AcrR family transcriptional regulator [Oscillospiraceae bacterium]